MNIQAPGLQVELARNSLRLPTSGRSGPLDRPPESPLRGAFDAEMATHVQADRAEPAARSAYRIAASAPSLTKQQAQPPSDKDWETFSGDDDATFPTNSQSRTAGTHEQHLARPVSRDPDAAPSMTTQLPVPPIIIGLPAIIPPVRAAKPPDFMSGFAHALDGLSGGPQGLTRGPLAWVAISAALIAVAMILL
ncbi:MAG: hypothetical protein JWM36_3766 [Hyphomicrobiales bacterium]|nr:hypothetical protein [Hyphomicrobiales bacterium]